LQPVGDTIIDADAKADLQRYLQVARESLVWKLEGLSEYDIRRPMVRTGTNLLGLVKHIALVDAGYLGEVFGRPFPEVVPGWEGEEPNADMWATPEESRDELVELYRRVWAHGDATIDALDLDAVGRVPWWPDGKDEVTLHRILVHLTTETHRHAGHADILRELIDGGIGQRAGDPNLPSDDDAWWAAYRDRLEQAAAEAGGDDP
jgi:uncharacterized damage-inducible protein DinB